MAEAPCPGRVIIHADGRSDADGVCTWAFIVTTHAGRRVHEDSGLAENPYGEPTSLLAEWTAAVQALRWVWHEDPARSVTLRVDAALISKALKNRRVTIRGYEGALALDAREHLAKLRSRGVNVSVQRVPRWRNRAADNLAQEVLEPDAPERPARKPGIPPPSRLRRQGNARRSA